MRPEHIRRFSPEFVSTISIRPLQASNILALPAPGRADLTSAMHKSSSPAPPRSFQCDTILRLAQWLMVQTGPGFPAGRIGIRSAERLEGPWSAFHPLYEIPEMLAASAARAEDVFCYAAKEHIEMASSPDSLCVTYLCNSLSFARQTHDLNLYRPRVIDLHFDEISRGKTRSAEQTHYGHLFTPSLAAYRRSSS